MERLPLESHHKRNESTDTRWHWHPIAVHGLTAASKGPGCSRHARRGRRRRQLPSQSPSDTIRNIANRRNLQSARAIPQNGPGWMVRRVRKRIGGHGRCCTHPDAGNFDDPDSRESCRHDSSGYVRRMTGIRDKLRPIQGRRTGNVGEAKRSWRRDATGDKDEETQRKPCEILFE